MREHQSTRAPGHRRREPHDGSRSLRLLLRAADPQGVRRSALGSLANSLACGSLKQRSLSPERLAARASGSPAVLGVGSRTHPRRSAHRSENRGGRSSTKVRWAVPRLRGRHRERIRGEPTEAAPSQAGALESARTAPAAGGAGPLGGDPEHGRGPARTLEDRAGDQPARVFERSEFARAPRPTAERVEAGRPRAAGAEEMPRLVRGPCGIDETWMLVSPGPPVPRSPSLSDSRSLPGSRGQPRFFHSSVASTRAETMPGSSAEWPEAGTITRREPGQALWRSQAETAGQTMS